MNIWSKMITALRGGVNEAGEAVIDAQALRILDQEIRDASEELNKSKDGLASIIAQQKLAEEKVNTIKADIKKNEGFILAALEKKDESLAQELAVRVANFENQLESETEAAKTFKLQADNLRESIRTADSQIKQLKQQTETVKATEAVQRAQKVVAERHSGSNSKLRTALDSLDRIHENQKLSAAKMAAATELAQESGESSLDQKLRDAGITGASKADDVLARMKAKTKK
ncbi:PspA/IM30 family protein [Arenicella xantha]|uniref:Phage shock protein A (PspA) family protein n=1 Tax=Arenicella xantha TaxID=644221 RepID=A0A395JJV8_9GAMM|nr:PspA/IM30 family protein [Arenicella xantha]RBP51012.1 phage shock protein A (PspA) family protein [Arenicella xantha]